MRLHAFSMRPAAAFAFILSPPRCAEPAPTPRLVPTRVLVVGRHADRRVGIDLDVIAIKLAVARAHAFAILFFGVPSKH